MTSDKNNRVRFESLEWAKFVAPQVVALIVFFGLMWGELKVVKNDVEHLRESVQRIEARIDTVRFAPGD